jgi:glycosyltransferase involved in cell wall biosynthesis
MRSPPFPPLPGGVLSVIVPIYNEAATVGAALDAILAKEIPGWRLEIILVESNSTDGTRDAVLARRDHPRVRLLLEDRPRGKGHAVRAGLAAATGDVVLIQDADLGSRHGEGGWAIRSFSDQPLQALVLNTAHWGFTLLINVSLGVWLRDPFTMYKVFRRDCLGGLRFECNRFDFDWELLIKLIRSGHRPIEIPVSYRSRSFKQGKKISMVRDPLTWLWALARFRFARL